MGGMDDLRFWIYDLRFWIYDFGLTIYDLRLISRKLDDSRQPKTETFYDFGFWIDQL